MKGTRIFVALQSIAAVQNDSISEIPIRGRKNGHVAKPINVPELMKALAGLPG